MEPGDANAHCLRGFKNYRSKFTEARHFKRKIHCGRPFVKRFALCCLTLVLTVLSVTLVYCGQTLERIKMKLGMVVGLAPAKLC